GRQRRSGASTRNNHGDRSTNQLGCQLWQPIEPILGPAMLNHLIFALDEARLLQALAKCAQAIRVSVGPCGVQEADYRHPRLLRARDERPRSRAAEQRDELASF